MNADFLLGVWLGGLVATVLTMVTDWTRFGSDHVFFHLARTYPLRVYLSTAMMVSIWPVLLTAVLAKAWQDAIEDAAEDARDREIEALREEPED